MWTPRYRCLSRHDAGAGADQHRGPVARPARKSSSRSPFPIEQASERPAAAPVAPLDLEVRPVASRRLLSRTAPTSTSPGNWSTSGWATVELPPGIDRPKMGPVATGLGEVFHYVVTGQGDDVDANCAPSTTGSSSRSCGRCKGTAEVNTWGGYEKQYQVRIDPQRLHQAWPDVRRSGRGRRAATTATSAAATSARTVRCCSSTASAAPSTSSRSGTSWSRPRRACRSACATWPTSRSATKFAAGPSPPTARAKSSSAWASCSWARTATKSPGT